MLDSLLTRHKPDILDCIANLSNDEVFTPPALANKMLDLLPPEVWTNPELRFLDPGCKSGVFLREAAKRLMKGLEAAIPDEDLRREHVFKNMLHGIAITELTAQMSRRTLYYSKDASSKNSVVQMPAPDGNIRYQNIAHTFKGCSCVHCGVAEAAARDLETLESHAYLFIHEELDPSMKFDVIIGNPPYQQNTEGFGAQARPLYQKFVQKAITLRPRYLSMITPSRWFAGGMGLDEFRAQMLADKRLRVLVDHADARDCFPGVEIKGGVSYFLWDQLHGKDARDKCRVENVTNGEVVTAHRKLNAYDIFVRNNKAISILEKVLALNEPSLADQVSGVQPFGLPTNFSGFSLEQTPNSVKLYARKAVGWVSPEKISSNRDWIPQWKVLTAMAAEGDGKFPNRITGRAFVASPNSACTMTYLVLGCYGGESEAARFVQYMHTRFFRFLVSLRKNTQHLTRDRFAFVPRLGMAESWDDAKLYARYGITAEEVAYIESMVKEMV